MAKVVRNVSLDYDVVEEWKLTQQKGKLSGVINDLLRNYLNVQKNELQPKEQLEHRRKKILETKAAIDAELLEVRTQLLEHENKESENSTLKEEEWRKYGEQIYRGDRLKFEKHWNKKYEN